MIRRTPYIFAYMPYDASSFEAGAYQFSDLLHELAGISPYVRTNTLLTTEDQMESGIGLDPLNNMKEVIEVFREHFPDNFTPDGIKSIWGERWEGGKNVVKIKFKWGGGSQSLICDSSISGPIPSQDTALNTWLHIVETIINWKRPLYLWCGDVHYRNKRKGVFYPDRTIANWFCWTPQQVNPGLIPSAALVRPMLDGTLIVTSEQYFNIDDETAIHRANDVEVEMNEAGILPSLDDLRKG